MTPQGLTGVGRFVHNLGPFWGRALLILLYPVAILMGAFSGIQEGHSEWIWTTNHLFD